MANDFQSGIQNALSIFTAVQQQSNYQAIQESRDQSRQLQASQLKRQETEDAGQAKTRDVTLARLSADPSHGVPDDVAIAQLNEVSEKHSDGTQVTKHQYRAFTDRIDAVLDDPRYETQQHREEALVPLADVAHTHGVYGRAFASRAERLAEWVQEPEARAMAGQMGFVKPTIDHLMKAAKPSTILKMVANKDDRAAGLYTQARSYLTKVANGEEIPDGELNMALGAAHGAGLDLGEKGHEIAKGTVAEPLYNDAMKHVDSLKTTTVEPLVKMVGQLDKGKVLMSLQKKSKFFVEPGLADLSDRAANHPISSLFGSPELKGAFSKLEGNLQAVAEKAEEDWTTHKTRYKQQRALAAARLGHTDADFTQLDQQNDILKQKYLALTEPWKRYQDLTKTPTEDALADFVGSANHLKDSTLRLETDKQALLSFSEQKAQEEIHSSKASRETRDATNEFGNALQALIPKHPGIRRADGTLDAAGLAKVATPLINSMKDKYKFGTLDATEIIQKIASASKPSVASDTLEKLSPEQAFKLETAVAGQRLTDSAIVQLFPEGKLDRKLLAQAQIGKGVPFTDGRTLKSTILNALDEEARARTGAAYPETEVPRFEAMFIPGSLDSESTVRTKLQNLRAHFSGKADLTDPQEKLRSRIKPLKSVDDVVQQGKSKAKPSGDSPAFNTDKYNELKKKFPNASKPELFDKMLEGH